jgi:hypothetical protein
MAGSLNFTFTLTVDTVAHYVPPGTGCAHGAPPDSPLGSLPAADGKSTEFTHSIGRRSKIDFFLWIEGTGMENDIFSSRKKMRIKEKTPSIYFPGRKAAKFHNRQESLVDHRMP